MKKTVRWGMIGTGDVTEIKSGPGLYKAENSVLKGVMNRTKAKAEDYARRHKVEMVFDTAEELINHPEIDAVYIATPPVTHKEYALKAIEAGKPVYIEKPLAMNYEEAFEIQKRAEEKGVKVFTAFYRRGLERFHRAKEFIEKGEIGSIRCITVNLTQPVGNDEKDRNNLPWRVKREIAGAGKFMDVGVHMLDILDYLAGPIKEIKGFASNQGKYYDVEDSVSAVWLFENGAHGAGNWNFCAYDNLDEIQITGSHGKITLPCFRGDWLKLEREGEAIEYVIPNPENIQQPYIQSIVNELIGKGKHPGSLESSVRVQKLMDEVLKDYYK